MKKHYRRLSLLEVIVALGILAVIMLGVAATITTARVAQGNTKERLSASMAAAAKLDEVAAFARTPTGFDDLAGTYDRTGFAVHHDPNEVGHVQGGPTAIQLDPATDASFPASRAGAPQAVKDLPGYVEVTPVAGRTDLVDVTVTIGWRSVAGNGSDERVVNQVRITR